jgi:hypothetical protein
MILLMIPGYVLATIISVCINMIIFAGRDDPYKGTSDPEQKLISKEAIRLIRRKYLWVMFIAFVGSIYYIAALTIVQETARGRL